MSMARAHDSSSPLTLGEGGPVLVQKAIETKEIEARVTELERAALPILFRRPTDSPRLITLRPGQIVRYSAGIALFGTLVASRAREPHRTDQIWDGNKESGAPRFA